MKKDFSLRLIVYSMLIGGPAWDLAITIVDGGKIHYLTTVGAYTILSLVLIVTYFKRKK
jgi:hypothetical protein